jgi:simple sugar transport system ATP-binding protein
VNALTRQLNLPLDPGVVTGTLPVALLQRLEIVKALAGDARILLLDEPTGVLAPSEADELLARTRAFAESGRAVGLITHKLDEALRGADHVTVLRRG